MGYTLKHITYNYLPAAAFFLVAAGCKTLDSTQLQSVTSQSSTNRLVLQQRGTSQFYPIENSILTYNRFTGEAHFFPQSARSTNTHPRKVLAFTNPGLHELKVSENGQVIVGFNEQEVFIWIQIRGSFTLSRSYKLSVSSIAIDATARFIAVAQKEPARLLVLDREQGREFLPYGPGLSGLEANKMIYRSLVFLPARTFAGIPEAKNVKGRPTLVAAVDRSLVVVGDEGAGRYELKDVQASISQLSYVPDRGVLVFFAPPMRSDQSGVVKLVEILPKTLPVFSSTYGHFNFNNIPMRLKPETFLQSPVGFASFPAQHVRKDAYKSRSEFKPFLFHLFATDFNGNLSVRFFHYGHLSEDERRAEISTYTENFHRTIFPGIEEVVQIHPRFHNYELEVLILTRLGDIYLWKFSDAEPE